MKHCRKCGTDKPRSEFSKAAKEKDGLQTQCKACKKIGCAASRAKKLEQYRQKSRDDYAKDPAAKLAKNRAWSDANKARHLQMSRDYYARNKDEQLALNRAWRAANPERMRAAEKAWKLANPEKVTAFAAKRRAAKLLRTPAWLTAEDIRKIEDFYFQAKRLSEETGILYEVDHILPLQAKLVSGLHVPSNLQVLPRSKNRSKCNSWAPE